jgi:hypothetical protein
MALSRNDNPLAIRVALKIPKYQSKPDRHGIFGDPNQFGSSFEILRVLAIIWPDAF